MDHMMVLWRGWRDEEEDVVCLCVCVGRARAQINLIWARFRNIYTMGPRVIKIHNSSAFAILCISFKDAMLAAQGPFYELCADSLYSKADCTNGVHVS